MPPKINQVNSVTVPLLLGVIVAVWLLSAVLTIAFLSTWEERAQFGDMFGATNALFSGLAFAILVYAMWLQRTELQLQRMELELTRAELSRTATAQEETQKTIALQVELMTLSADLAATAALLEANQRVQSTKAEHYGIQLERLQRELHTRIQDLQVLKPEPGPPQL